MLEYYFFFGLFKIYKKVNFKIMKKRFLYDMGVDTGKAFRRMRDL